MGGVKKNLLSIKIPGIILESQGMVLEKHDLGDLMSAPTESIEKVKPLIAHACSSRKQLIISLVKT